MPFAAGILRLHAQLEWVTETLKALDSLRTGPMGSFADRAFLNAINRSIHDTYTAYENAQYREAVKAGFFDLQTARCD